MRRNQRRYGIYLLIAALAIAQLLVWQFSSRASKLADSVHPLQVLLLFGVLLAVVQVAQGGSIRSVVGLAGMDRWRWSERIAGLVPRYAASILAIWWLLFSFRGRLGRRSFWFAIVAMGIVTRLSTLQFERATDPAARIGLLCACILGLWSCIALQAKRLHDIGWSGFVLLANLMPVVGPIATLALTALKRGTEGSNRFGPDPAAHH